MMSALLLISPAGAIAATLPQGGVITVGDGSMVSGGNQLVINQITDKLGINWQSFNVGADGHVLFKQPGKDSIALNRVIGSDGSSILGKIDANGQVFLINPNGVIFGKGAEVNVGGLVASTLNITDADFKSGNYKFNAGAGNGDVVNLGSLQSAEGGYIALLGKTVKNHGVIKAKLGNATLAAGDAVTLDFSGDELIKVQVDKSTINALVENKGLIQADGGQVLMTARASNALLNTVVNNEGVIQAQTIENRGGKIFLDGGMDSGTVTVAGTLDASAPVHGDGGFIETSGAHVIIADGTKVTTLSKEGRTGDWLVDPTDFHVVSGTGAQTSSQIGATTLQNNLATTNVTLQTSDTDIGEAGDINIDADVLWHADTKLTLTAHNKVNINADVRATGNNAGLAINAPNGFTLTPNKRVRLSGTNSTYSENGVDFIRLRTVNDLNLLSNAADGQRFFLADDLAANATSGWNAGAGYIPPGGWDRGAIEGLVIEGFGNSIYNLHIKLDNDYSGLIGWANNASIRNLDLDADVGGFGYSGILAGYLSNSTVTNVRTFGTIHGTNADDVGGIIGHAKNVNINGSSSSAIVTGTNNVGGIVGYAESGTTISNTRFGGIVTGQDADSDYTGGIVGYAKNSTLSNSFNAGTVNGANYAGGLIGSSVNSTVIRSGSYGRVNGIQATGGLIGIAKDSTISEAYSNGAVNGLTQTGGLIGKAVNLTINDVYADGDVTGTTYTGGLIGDLSGGSINRAFSLSSVFGTNYVGGFAGRDAAGEIINAYAGGDVTGTRYIGGFLGSVANSTVKFTYSLGAVVGSQNVGGYSGNGAGNTITESFWDTQSSGQATSVHGLGKTTAEMHSASTFANWDIGTQGGTGEAWRIYDGFTGPMLRFAMTTATVSGNDKNLTYSGHAVTEDELKADGAYGYTTGMTPDNFWSYFGDEDPEVLDNEFILGGNTHDGGKAIRNAGTYTADKFYSTQFGYDLIETAPKTIVIDKANLTVSASGDSKIYDGSTSAGVSFSDNRLGTDDLVIGSAGSNFSDKNAGTGKTITVNGITVTGEDALNYNWNTSAVTTGDIAKANLNVSASGGSKTYDGNTSASTILGDNRIAGDDLVLSSGSSTFSDKNAGTGKTVTIGGITVTGTDADNYLWNESTSTTADISKATLNISASGSNRVYDGGTSATVRLGDNRIAGDDLVISSSGSAFADKNAGNGKTITVNGITVTGTDADNYDWSGSVTTTADISKAVLNIGAIGQDKSYNGSTAADVTFSDDRIAGDNLVISSGSSTFSDKNAGTGKTVTVGGITLGGTDADNYSFNTDASTTADISKAVLNISASGQDKVYDGSSSAGVTFTDDRISGDNLTISGSGSFADKNAGSGKVITVGGIAVSGTDAQNYTWDGLATTTATISKALLNIFANAQDKGYDGTNNAQVTLGDDRISGDLLQANYGSSTFSDKNAGTGKTVTVGGITLSGSDADNYTVSTTATAQADITKANLVIKADNASKVEGSADGDLGWNIQSGNLFGDDSIDGTLARDSGEAAGLYDINQGDLTAGSNYVLSVVPGIFEITEKVKPPVIVDPIEPPVIDPPTPPVVEPPKPPKPPVNVELENAKDVVSTISVAAKTATAAVEPMVNAESGSVGSGYRLLNLGMKLPDDLTSEDGATF
ncbi:YDG domain-containing protein [Pseudomonas sp. PLMAX]|uniref:YDG domain-containing protein n=1 Tax=Pseudomonas sp. PLMAX TaxID=2201998 RepID=UPI0038B8CC47